MVLEIAEVDAETLRRVRAGEIFTRALEDATATEISGLIVAFVKAPFDELIDQEAVRRTMEFAQENLEIVQLRDDRSIEEQFAEVSFDEDERGELEALLKVKAGPDFNLSAAEIVRFQALARRFQPGDVYRDPVAREAVMEEYRGVLRKRYRSYREGGIASIEDYDRGGGASSPREAFRVAIEEWAPLKGLAPALHQAIADYPDHQLEGMINLFYCQKQEIQGRPTFVLSHRMGVIVPGRYAFGGERHFFVGRSYYALSMRAGIFAVEGGTLVLIGNRTSSDQLAGMAQAMRHRLGRSRMLESIADQWRAIQREYGGQ